MTEQSAGLGACEAIVTTDPWNDWACSRRATGSVLGVWLCGQHRASAERHQKTSPGALPWNMPRPRTQSDRDGS